MTPGTDRWLIGTAATLACLGLGCSLWLASSRASLPDIPSLSIRNPSVNMGPISCSERSFPVVFEIENLGVGELLLKDVGLSCACGQPVLSRDRIPSGEQATLTLNITPREVGPQSVSALILTNDPEKPRTEIGVVWTAYSGVRLEPNAVEAGDILPGQTISQIVRIDEVAPGGVIERVEADHDAIRVNLLEGDRISVSIIGPEQNVTSHGTVVLHVAGVSPSSFRIPVSWTVRRPIEAIPSELFLGSVAVDSDLSAQVELVSTQKQVLRFEGWEVEPPSPGMRVDPRIEDGRLIVNVSQNSGMESGLHESTMTLKTSAGAVNVPLRWLAMKR